MPNFAEQRLEAVAQALANVKYPLSVDPKASEPDRIEAEKFLAMLDAAWKIECERLAEAIKAGDKPTPTILIKGGC